MRKRDVFVFESTPMRSNTQVQRCTTKKATTKQCFAKEQKRYTILHSTMQSTRTHLSGTGEPVLLGDGLRLHQLLQLHSVEKK